MPVTYFSEDDQLAPLTQYNAGKKPHLQIPVVPRNFETGWPLLQVSLYSVISSANEIRYDPVLGGGKCHAFGTDYFSLACLLSKVPGTIEVSNTEGRVDEKQFNLTNVHLFLQDFYFHHKQSGVKISSKSGAYGKILNIVIPDCDVSTFSQDGFRFAKENGARLANFGSYDEFKGYTSREIRQAIKKEQAIFAHGQIFVDFGAFLGQSENKELNDFFRDIFKVDEFLSLKQQGAFKPSFTREELEANEQKVELQFEVSHSLEQKKNDAPMLKELCTRIEKMKHYGESLHTHKGQVAIELARVLENKLDDFYKQPIEKQSSGLAQFKVDFVKCIREQERVMAEHQAIWKPIVLNILIALTGIGLIAIAIKAVKEASISGGTLGFNQVLFFAKPNSQQQSEAIEKLAGSVTPV